MKKSMRRVLLFAAILLFLVLLLLIPLFEVPTRITAEKLSKNTGLPFRLLERTPDFSGEYGLIGGFGITGYYDRKYEGEAGWNDDNDFDAQKSGGVIYYVSKWQDTLTGQNRITNIVVGDPDITLLGCRVGDSTEAFAKALTEAGFCKTDGLYCYRKNGVYVSLSPDEETGSVAVFTLFVKPSNLFGIQY